ncbi:MAG TPA: hypothetical protein VM597_18880 [Gemmataceae bacterium]|jgi:hypothetical protein|nr:hypothetical protein [Gemmataceae bacterium]
MSKNWPKGFEEIWVEDECLRHDPGAEHVDAAYSRLFAGCRFVEDQQAAVHVDFGDHGVHFIPAPDGWRAVQYSYDGYSIYKAKQS